MKKLLLLILTVAGILLTSSEKAQAQTQPFKIGVFDIEIMMQVMPGYRTVDSLVQVYERDSLAAEYDFYQSEYQRLDSTFKADSAAKKAPTVLNIEKQQRQQIALNLVYWQQIAQNKSGQKRGMLSQPIYEKVAAAYKKVLDAKKYSLVLKPNSYEPFGSPAVENVFALVARELRVPLPAELGGAPEAGNDTKPSAQGAKKPAGKN